jgi:hypothetical protein
MPWPSGTDKAAPPSGITSLSCSSPIEPRTAPNHGPRIDETHQETCYIGRQPAMGLHNAVQLSASHADEPADADEVDLSTWWLAAGGAAADADDLAS